MRLNKIEIQNYRCFDKLAVEFPNQLSVIVGNNATGKSTILDAAAIMLGTFLTGFDLASGHGIGKEDARNVSYEMGSVVDLQPQFPVKLHAWGEVVGRKIDWIRALNSSSGRTTMVDAKEMSAISAECQSRVRQGDKSLILPIISYYGTGRLWAQKKESRKAGELQRFSRLSGYMDCLAPESNEKMMLKWFQKMTIQSSQSEKLSPEFQAVKEAIAYCFQSITGYTKIDVQFNLDTHDIDIIYCKENQDNQTSKYHRFPMKDLSDGYKNTLSMIADIAYRMAILNPQLSNRVLKETPGVILIDEVDLHLHPQWQQRILKDLTELFPNVQFIVTTHAPAVINSIKKESLIALDEYRNVYVPASETYGRDMNSVVREVMGISERPQEIQNMFHEFNLLLRNEKYVEAQHMLNEIESQIGSDDPELNGSKVALELEQI